MVNIVLRPAGAYDPAVVHQDLQHFADVARAIHAGYWVMSLDDGDTQWRAAKPLLMQRFTEIQNVLPEVFRSGGGRVRIYALPCVANPDAEQCATAKPVLFPEGVR